MSGKKSIRIKRSTEVDLINSLIETIDNREIEVNNIISIIEKNVYGKSYRIRQRKYIKRFLCSCVKW